MPTAKRGAAKAPPSRTPAVTRVRAASASSRHPSSNRIVKPRRNRTRAPRLVPPYTFCAPRPELRTPAMKGPVRWLYTTREVCAYLSDEVVAALCGVGFTAVSNWKSEGFFPPAHYIVMNAEILRISHGRVRAPAALWRMSLRPSDPYADFILGGAVPS